jgi:Raf kinase inhibitor-like YbhB/YbcL family protein
MAGMDLRSPDFDDYAPIPQRHARGGENLSPALDWSAPPPGTAELALLVEDPDAPRGTFVHWVVADVDPSRAGLGRGEFPAGAVQGRNGFGVARYDGPQPPAGDPPHRYVFEVSRPTPRWASRAVPPPAPCVPRCAATCWPAGRWSEPTGSRRAELARAGGRGPFPGEERARPGRGGAAADEPDSPRGQPLGKPRPSTAKTVARPRDTGDRVTYIPWVRGTSPRFYFCISLSVLPALNGELEPTGTALDGHGCHWS